jgi:FMN phosphatase YigB (HAD superfamily)
VTQSSSATNDLISEIVNLSNATPKDRTPLVIFDIDGTLVDVSTIQHFVSENNRDFDTFHRQSINCPPYLQILEIAKGLIQNSLKVMAISGRQEKYRGLTDYWLAMNSLPLHELVLRPNEYQGNRIEFKTEAYRSLTTRYKIIAIFDNDPQLLTLWLSTQIPIVVQCPELILLKRN